MSSQPKSMFSLEGKTVLLTGASGYLGRTMGQAFLENHARVIALGRSERLDTLKKDWQEEFGENRVNAVRVDMYDIPKFSRVLDEILAQESFVDVLINNAYELGPETGFNTPLGTLEDASHEQWMRNLTGGIYWAALTIQKFAPTMKERGHGSIINVSTMYAHVAPDPQLYADTDYLNPPGYSAAKAGLLALTRYTASFLGPFGVRCNAILPGPFSNTEDSGPNTVEEGHFFLERLKERTCLRRLGKAEELVGPLLFLASGASSFVTGHSLVVDGGWTIT